MNHLLRKLSVSSGRNHLLRIVAGAAGGAVVCCAVSDNDFKTRLSVSLPLPLGEHVRLSWPAYVSSDQWSHEVLPSFSFRVSPVPSEDVPKEEPANTGESLKPCCGGLGRDSIANAAARVAVTLQDGRKFDGTVVNVDLQSDIAIVKINSKTPLPTAKLGSSSKLRPGDWVIAMGCPLSLQNTVTAGIVSCVDRKSSELGIAEMRTEYLQTDCAINAGNSGGPLVNIDGEVIGVNRMKVLGADGLGFAVPIDLVAKIIGHFQKNGRVIRPWLGLKMVDLNEMIIAQLKERDPKFPNVRSGILVAAVTPGSPGNRGGILPGDVVTEFDGKPVGSFSEIIEIMEDRIGIPMQAVVKRPGDRVITLTVIPEETSPDI